jgi:hypothetical protein
MTSAPASARATAIAAPIPDAAQVTKLALSFPGVEIDPEATLLSARL